MQNGSTPPPPLCPWPDGAWPDGAYGDPEEPARPAAALDADGRESKEGSVVVDDMFGEGKLRTAPFLSSMVMG